MTPRRKLLRRAWIVAAATALVPLASTVSATAGTPPSQPPPPAKAAPAPTPTPTPQGLSGLSEEVRAKMAARAPYGEAAKKIRAAADSQGGGSGLAGINIGESHVDVYWKGAPNAGAADAIKAQSSSVEVRLHQTPYSFGDLRKAADALEKTTLMKTPDSPFHSVIIPVDGTGLVLGAYPGTQDKVAKALPASAVPLAVEYTPAPVPTDSRAVGGGDGFYYGGIQLYNPSANMYCSAGWPFTMNGKNYIATAGHCGNIGDTFTNNGRALGKVTHKNAGRDTLLIEARPGIYIYDGPGLIAEMFGISNLTYRHLKAIQSAASLATAGGESLCQGGAYSGTVCGIVTTGRIRDIKIEDGTLVKGLAEALKTNGVAVRSGDSGGPVFAPITTSWQYRNRFASKCLDADLNTIGKDGTKMQIWSCTGWLQQHWALQADGTIRNTLSGQCLDADLGTISSSVVKVQAWSCHGGLNQQWYETADERIKSRYNNRCLTISNTSRADGTTVVLVNCYSDGSMYKTRQVWERRWEVVARGIVNTGSYNPITIAFNGRCLDADDNSPVRNGTRVRLWDCDGSDRQRWDNSGNGQIISRRFPGYCLDANPSGGNVDGAEVYLWQCNWTSQQTWNTLGDGSIPVRNKAFPGRCLDADLWTIGTNGTRIQMWSCNNSQQQAWGQSTRMHFMPINTITQTYSGLWLLTS